VKFGTQGEVADVITCTEFLVNSIFTQFVEELRSSTTPKLAFPADSVYRPYNSVLIIINYNICQQLLRTVCRRGTPRRRCVRRGPRRRGRGQQRKERRQEARKEEVTSNVCQKVTKFSRSVARNVQL